MKRRLFTFALALAALAPWAFAAPPVSYYGPEHRILVTGALIVIQAPGRANGVNAGHYQGGDIHRWLNAAQKIVQPGLYGPSHTIDLGDGVTITTTADDGEPFTGDRLRAWLREASKVFK